MWLYSKRTAIEKTSIMSRNCDVIKVISLFLVLIFASNVGYGARKERKTRSPKWWALAKMSEPNNVMIDSHQRISNSITRFRFTVLSRAELKAQPLTKKQRKIVRRNPGSLQAIADGAKMAVKECQHQFRNRRWNCPTTQYMKGRSIFGKIVRIACRETAFLYSMTSAAVAHTVSRACSEGQLSSCTCDYSARHRQIGVSRMTSSRNPNRAIDFQWGGCSDNIQFGNKFARDFVDAAERGRDQRYVMNVHNNEVGRLHVKSMMHRECKCHGMSGSCTVKTCWMRLANFRDVGNNLKAQFDGASRVLAGNDGRNRYHISFTDNERVSDVQLEPYNPDHRPPRKSDLVYFDVSPNFCNRNRRAGIRGTIGRHCNSTSLGVDGCDLMCCGRGFKTQIRQVQSRCKCTFHWCCEVKCEVCKFNQTIHTCL